MVEITYGKVALLGGFQSQFFAKGFVASESKF
jgi:hypothetical protein